MWFWWLKRPFSNQNVCNRKRSFLIKNMFFVTKIVIFESKSMLLKKRLFCGNRPSKMAHFLLRHHQCFGTSTSFPGHLAVLSGGNGPFYFLFSRINFYRYTFLDFYSFIFCDAQKVKKTHKMSFCKGLWAIYRAFSSTSDFNFINWTAKIF